MLQHNFPRTTAHPVSEVRTSNGLFGPTVSVGTEENVHGPSEKRYRKKVRCLFREETKPSKVNKIY